MLLFIGAPELFIVFLVVVLFFGADKIPEIAKGLAKGMRQIKHTTNEIKNEINESGMKAAEKTIQETTEKLEADLNDFGTVKRTPRFKKIKQND